MLIAYIDEFGHQGPYISHNDKKYGTHPIFGYGGFIIPDYNVRALGGYFEHIKENLLRWEIEKAKKHPRRWEKKGSALLTSRNIKKYGSEIEPALRRIYAKLTELDGQVFFFGKQKPIGTVKQTGETTEKREERCLIETIKRLGRVASKANERIFVIMDATDTDNRERAVATLGKTIYSRLNHDTNSIIEIPIQADSHLYGNIQLADWSCALLGRLSDYHFSESAEHAWSVDFGRKVLRKTKFTSNSIIWSNSPSKNSCCHANQLFKTMPFWQWEAQREEQQRQKIKNNQQMRQKLIDAGSPEFHAKLDEIKSQGNS